MDVPEKDYAFFDVEVADSGRVRELGAIGVWDSATS